MDYQNIILAELMQPMEDSDTSSSDDELILALYNTRTKKTPPEAIVKINNDISHILNNNDNNDVENIMSTYDSETFQAHYRTSIHIVYMLIDKFDRSSFTVANTRGKQKVSSEKTILLCVWYLTSTDTFRQISDRFEVSMSTAHAVLLRGLNFLTSLCNEYIKWPTNEEVPNICSDFKSKSGIDNIIGAIDCCHIKINKPREHGEDYINRSGYCSILLQGIVDSNQLFLDIYCGEPGSLQDDQLLRKSGIFTQAENPNTFGDYYLLGDSAYPSLPWLVPPFKDDESLTEAHREFNFIHSSTRIVIEQSFGLLKARFKRLHKMEHLDIETSVKSIKAACVLHNICILEHDNTHIEVENGDENLVDVISHEAYDGRSSRREDVFRKMFPNN